MKLFSALPARKYEVLETRRLAVQMNFHVLVDKHFYSVPFEFRHDPIDVVISDSFVEIHLDGAVAAVHDRVTAADYRFSTIPDHMPKSDDLIPWNETSGRSLRSWAERIGPAVLKVINYFLGRDEYEAYGYINCTRILHQATEYGPETLRSVCEKTVNSGRYNVREIISACSKSRL